MRKKPQLTSVYSTIEEKALAQKTKLRNRMKSIHLNAEKEQTLFTLKRIQIRERQKKI